MFTSSKVPVQRDLSAMCGTNRRPGYIFHDNFLNSDLILKGLEFSEYEKIKCKICTATAKTNELYRAHPRLKV